MTFGKTLNKNISIIMIVIFISLTMISFVAQNGVKEEVDESVLPNLLDENTSVEPPSVTATSDDWFSGETVKSDIGFNRQPMDYDYIHVQGDQFDDTFTFTDRYRQNSLADDESYHGMYVFLPSADSFVSYTIGARIYCGGSGIVSYEQRLWAHDVADIYTTEAKGTVEVSSELLDAQGYLYVQWYCSIIMGTETMDFKLYLLDADWSRIEVFHEEESGTPTISAIDYFFVASDYFYFQRTTIENNIRSEYQYVSDTVITHSLIIPSVPHAKEINIYSPVHWTYSSCNPIATVTTVDSDHTITSPTELTYTMIFTSNSDYLLGISDSTINYLTSTEATFESGSLGDWFDWRLYWYGSGNEMDTFEVSTEIAQEGYHSMHIETTADAYPTVSMIIDNDDLNLADGFYLSFWYYWVSTDTFRFSVRNELNTEWDTYTLPTTVTNRWIRYCAYFEGTSEDGYGKSFEFYGADASSTMEIFIDNFEVFTVSTEIDTVELDTYTISSTFVSWDGYQNPALTYEDVFLELWDRTDDSVVSTEETTTNGLGISTWVYEASLEQKEYIIMAYTFNNRFGDPATMDKGDTWDFDEDEDEDWDQYDIFASVSGGYAYDEEDISRYGNDLDEHSSGEIDGSLYRKLIVRYKTNVSDWYLKFIEYAYGFNLEGDEAWHIISYDLPSTFEIIWTQIEIRSNFALWVYFDYILLAGSAFLSEFYFTPSYPYNLETTVNSDGNNYIDFSEYSLTNDDSHNDLTQINWEQAGSANVTDGYLTWLKNTDRVYTYTEFDTTTSADFSVYSYYIIRFWCNESDHVVSAAWGTAAGSKTEPIGVTIANTWVIFEEDLALDSEWVNFNGENLGVKLNTAGVTYDAVEIRIDYIRLVHVEEEEHYITDNFIGIGSENDQWISAVYSDDIYLGNYADPLLVYYNGTIGDHTISWLPLDRKNEIKAYLHSDLYEYHYQVSLADNYFLLLNPPSFDVAAGLVYLDIVTFWGNTTYRCKDNSTWLGDAVAEGSSAWTFNPTPGHHVFTVEIYNGEDTWFTLTSSITIPSTEVENLQLLLLTKDVDTSVSQVFVNYHTNWGNTTLIVFDNTTQLGNELSGEGASIWSFSQMDYYAFHNISVCIYHNSELQFIYHFSFTIQAPMLPDNYFILLNPPSYDVDAGLIYLDVVTYYGNCTYQVKMNESSLGDAVNEGSSVWSCSFSQAGFYNFTVYVYQGGTVWRTLTSSITIAEPATPEGLIIEIWNKDVDVAAGLIYINVITSWGNQSVGLQDNSTSLGDYASEGASIWLFPTTFGLHNISIWLYNDLTPVFVEYFSFTIQEPSLEIFTVHFDLFTLAGIGLPFETAKIYVNDSRIYNPQQYYLEDSFIEVKVRDYYDHLLFATNATITANRDIALYVRLFGQQIRNTYKIPIEVYFISTFDSNYNHSYIVAAEGSISVLLFSSSYHVLVKPLQDEYQNSTHVTYFYATTSEYQDLGDETKSYTISMETDLEPLDLEEPKEVRTWPAWVIAASAIFINAILISFIGAMGKWGIVKIWNYGLYYPNYGANWILRKFGSERELHWCVEHKGGLEFVTPEQYRKAEALKKEGQF